MQIEFCHLEKGLLVQKSVSVSWCDVESSNVLFFLVALEATKLKLINHSREFIQLQFHADTKIKLAFGNSNHCAA